MSRIKKVLIVGGGIGGLSTAIALQKIGIETEIVEVNEEFNVYGVGIILHSNALRALNELGVIDEVYKQGKSFNVTEICNSNGELIHEVPAVKAGNFETGIGIRRRELHNVLYEAAVSEGTKFRMGTTVDVIQNIIDGTDGVYVELSDDTSGVYDLVIGADGVSSKVRNMLFDADEPKFVGQGVWRYTMNRPKELPEHSLQLYYGKKAKAGIVPMSADTVYVFVVSAEPGNPWKSKDQLHVLMRESLAEFGGAIPDLSKQITNPEGVIYRPLSTILVKDPWHRGNVVLIGDAAHATVPHVAMGAAISIEDGLVLAELLDQGIPVKEVLDQYMERRFERCKLVVDNSNTLVEWELLQLAGKLPEENDPNVVVGETVVKLAKPY